MYGSDFSRVGSRSAHYALRSPDELISPTTLDPWHRNVGPNTVGVQ